MKYCFFLQRRFALLGHTLALNIATKNPTATFCGVVQGRQYFDMLSSQKELTYTSLILDEDIHKKLTAHHFLPFTYDPLNRKLHSLSKFTSTNTIYIRDITLVEKRIKSANKISIFSEKF